MPILKMKMSEIIDRISEIPDTEDCYIISITDLNDVPLIPYEVEVNIPIGCILLSSEVDCISNARYLLRPDRHIDQDEDNIEEWKYYWDNNQVYVTFQFNEGVPKTPSGTLMLPHIVAYGYCSYCGRQIESLIDDCPDRRLRALVTDMKEGKDISPHVDAYRTWHENRRRRTE